MVDLRRCLIRMSEVPLYLAGLSGAVDVLLGTWAANIYRGTSLIRIHPPLGPYRRPMPRVLRWSY